MKRIVTILIALALGAPAYADTYLSGFAELTQAVRVEANPALDSSLSLSEREYPRGDLRAQLKLSGGGDRDEYFLRLDFLSDYALERDVDVSIREGYVKLYLASWMDAKVGRQVATWGTGDLLFVNDLFAKDWVAFFTGQELSYLKRPQDLARISFYKGGTTFEIAASPYYTTDNLPTGERLSIYNPFLQMTVNQDNAPIVAGRAKRLDNGELFARISGYFGATEWALYGYNGFFPQPLGVRMAGGPAGAPVLFAPQLSAVGASARGQLSSLLVNAEGAVYLSEDDSDGADPSLPNSALKALVGVERSLGGETTVSGQWFGDLTLDYDAYAEPFISAGGTAPVAELRHTVTLRVTKLMLYQTVKLSFFGYWGISDEDYYLRPSIEYDYTDNLQITLGANWLGGDHPYTMFGQFRDNSNLYLRLRRSF